MNLKIVPFVAIPLILIAGHSEQQPIQTLLTQAQLPVVAAPQPSTQIQPPASPTTETQRLYLAGRRVSFVPPAGFTAMTPEEIALKFPQGTNQPQPVYANKRRTVSVAITFSQAQISPEQLPELKNFLPKFLELAVPGIKWITQGFTVINKVRWIQLDFISKAIDTNIHNDAYFTSFDGKMLGFNFNSTVEQYDAVKTELRKSRDSIIIR
ncbi:MAG: hypothetical protein KME05_05080 [Gloeocapsa sp. UFS-A4-WI-NPMV-4B04]|jgi:hypothetical protein|nr:hypothetical protein [Gloeocapsa sp. UFS-A4-WI-NPMV-4B04]